MQIVCKFLAAAAPAGRGGGNAIQRSVDISQSFAQASVSCARACVCVVCSLPYLGLPEIYCQAQQPSFAQMEEDAGEEERLSVYAGGTTAT